jgi:signal transduction histidine kinase
MGQFLHATVHDLRTPLTSIIGFSQMMLDGQVAPGSAEQREFTRDILTSGGYLKKLTDDLLDIALIEAGKLRFEPQPVRVETTIQELANLQRAQARAHDLRVSVEIDPAIGVVEIDPIRFRQIVTNYLSNALKFSPAGGRVVVRATVETAELFRVEVEDSGAGIPADKIERLFQDFERLEAGALKRPGTGIGLALTRRLVEAQGGQVGVRSVPDHGSVFFAVLPRRARPAG